MMTPNEVQNGRTTLPGEPGSGSAWRVVLASASPARLKLLRQAGIQPEVVVSAVDESQLGGAAPAVLATGLAELKATTVYTRLTAGRASDQPADRLIVIGCDSVLDVAGEALGKPGSAAAATALWRRLRGSRAGLVTGHHLIVVDAQGERRITRAARTDVSFAWLDDDEIEAYAATGEPEQVAGGFTIDGLGGPFVTGVVGDPHNVVGLSLPLLRLMLAELGVRWTTLWP